MTPEKSQAAAGAGGASPVPVGAPERPARPLPELPAQVPAGAASAEPSRRVLLGGLRAVNLWTLNVGLACCLVEVAAASAGRGATDSLGSARVTTDAAQADVLLISGTVTTKMAPRVRELYDAMAEPRFVVAFGACATSGGPYWDSYSVINGAHEVVPVDLVVPGCPPEPDALLAALAQIHDHVAHGRPPAVAPVGAVAPGPAAARVAATEPAPATRPDPAAEPAPAAHKDPAAEPAPQEAQP